MKMKFFVALFALALLALPLSAPAHEYDRNDSDYPLRYIAYVAYPLGIAVEYGVLRPIHWVVSRANLSIIFGHEPRAGEDNYFTWE